MDVSISQRQKHCDPEEEDIISKLPDSIVSHILSFLTTLDSVRTCCLSRRWRYLWASVPVLDFEDALYADQCQATDLAKKCQHFESFVNTVFILHTNSSIKKLRLHLDSVLRCDFMSSSYVNSWILAASARNVEELDITAKAIRVNIPRILFDSESLVTLKLCSSFAPIFPELVNLPSLKVLHLHCPCLSYTSMNRIISGCPVLEDLVVEIGNSQFGVRTLSLLSASLKRFEFRNMAMKNNLCSVILNAPRLKFLHLEDVFSQEPYTEINDFSSVKKATFDFAHCGDNLLDHCRLQMVPIVEKFKIEALSLSFFTLIKALVGKSIDKLHCSVKLTHLVLGYCRADLKILSSVLESFPNLEVLELKYQNCNHAIECEALIKEKSEIYCLKHSLKTLKLRSFTGKEAEMRVIRYFLGNAKVLKMVRIYTEKESEVEVLKKLLMFPRCSETCQIVVSSN